MTQHITSNQPRQRRRAIETLSSVVSLAAVVGITSWACTIAIGAGVI